MNAGTGKGGGGGGMEMDVVAIGGACGVGGRRLRRKLVDWPSSGGKGAGV